MKEKDDQCALCQYAIGTLYQILDNKDNEEEVKNALESLCRLMPDSIEDKCEEYVDAYADKILEFVLKNMTPDEICSALGLCPGAKPVQVSVQDSKCIMCEYVLST